MSEPCISCIQAKNKLNGSRDSAIKEGREWAQASGLAKYAIVLTVNRNSYKYVPFDEPNIERFPEYEYVYM